MSPIPTPPIKEVVTWEVPNPSTAPIPHTVPDLKQAAMDLTQRVPSRRNSDCHLSVTSPSKLAEPVPPRDFARQVAQQLIQQYPVVTANKNNVTDLKAPQVGIARNLTHVSTPAPVAGDVLDTVLYPAFLRKRYVPPRHHVVTEEVGRELISDDKDTKRSALVAAFLKQNTDGGEEETWNRLNELTTFALVGFGFFTVKLGTGTYNRERLRYYVNL